MGVGKKIAGGGAVAAMAAGMVMMQSSPSAKPKTVTVAWTLEATPLSNFLVSFVQSRTNARLGAWIERTNFAYRAGSNGATLAMDKPQEFFRPGWRFK